MTIILYCSSEKKETEIIALVTEQPFGFDITEFCHESKVTCGTGQNSGQTCQTQRSLLHAQMPKQSSKKIPGLTFHQFPKDKALRKQWIYKIHRDFGKNFKVSY